MKKSYNGLRYVTCLISSLFIPSFWVQKKMDVANGGRADAPLSEPQASIGVCEANQRTYSVNGKDMTEKEFIQISKQEECRFHNSNLRNILEENKGKRVHQSFVTG